MRPEQVGLYAPPTVDVAGLLDLARRTEAAGLDRLWFTDSTFVRDPVVHAAAVAPVLQRTGVGLGLVHDWQHLPASLATAVATLAGLAARPPALVLGPWHEPAARQSGADRRGVVRALADTTRVVVPLLRGEESATGARLTSPAPEVPVLWGANGPRMVTAAAGLVGEGLLTGVMVNYLHPAERVAEIAAEVGAGGGAEVVAVVLVVPGDDEAAAVAQVRAAVAATPALRHEAGLAEDVEVSDDLVRARIAAGPHWLRRLEDFLDAGATRVAVFTRQPDAVLPALAHLAGGAP